MAQPQHGNVRPSLRQHLVDEALGHGAVAVDPGTDPKLTIAVNRDAARSEATGSMVDMAMAVGVMGVGRAGGHVGEDDSAAGLLDAFGQRRRTQGAAGDAALVLQEIGMPGIMDDEGSLFDQRQGVP